MKGSLAIGVGDMPTSMGELLGAPGSVLSDIVIDGIPAIAKGDVSTRVFDLVHVVFPIIAWAALMFKGGPITLPAIALPDEFWMAWGGAVSIYILGRSSEKAGGEVGGLMGKMYGMISGTKK